MRKKRRLKCMGGLHSSRAVKSVVSGPSMQLNPDKYELKYLAHCVRCGWEERIPHNYSQEMLIIRCPECHSERVLDELVILIITTNEIVSVPQWIKMRRGG